MSLTGLTKRHSELDSDLEYWVNKSRYDRILIVTLAFVFNILPVTLEESI